MSKKLYHGLLLSSLILTSAQVRAADDWDTKDKAQHFAAGAVIGFAGMAVQDANSPDRFRNAVLAGTAVGLLKEVRDDLCKCGTASAKDFIVTVAGAVAGAGLGFYVFPEKNGMSVGVVKPF